MTMTSSYILIVENSKLKNDSLVTAWPTSDSEKTKTIQNMFTEYRSQILLLSLPALSHFNGFIFCFSYDRDSNTASLPKATSLKSLGSTGNLTSVSLLNIKGNSSNSSTMYQTLPNRRTLKNARTFMDR